MSKITSHVELMRIQYQYNKMQVLWLTRMSDAQHALFVYDTGMQWLCRFTRMTEDQIRWLLSQPEIWQWWRNEWHRRDAMYLPSLYEAYQANSNEVEARYRMLHQEAFIRFTPPYNLLSKHYTEVINQMANH